MAYYGYDWPVEDNTQPLPLILPQDQAHGYAEIVSYTRMKTEPKLSGQGYHGDDAAQEAWCDSADPKDNSQRRA